MNKHEADSKHAPQTPALWTWANAVYARPGVADSLIAAQDHAGLNVNLVLWACWTATLFEEAPESATRRAIDAVSRWSDAVTAPIRAARRSAKPFEGDADYDGAAELRSTLQSCERDAEKIELDLLDHLAHRLLTPTMRGDAMACARRNLASYAALCGAAKREGFSTALLHRVIDNIFQAPPVERTRQERDAS